MTSYVGIFKGRDWLETQSWSQEDLKTLIDAAKDLKKKYKEKVSTADILRDIGVVCSTQDARYQPKHVRQILVIERGQLGRDQTIQPKADQHKPQ